MKEEKKLPDPDAASNGAYQKLIEYNKAVIASWLKRSGSCTASIWSIGPECATIRVTEPNYNCVSGKARVFIICFGKKAFDKPRSPRWVRIDPRALDPFDKDDKVEREKLKLVMFFAEHLNDIENELVNAPKAKKLYNAWWRIHRKLYGISIKA